MKDAVVTCDCDSGGRFCIDLRLLFQKCSYDVILPESLLPDFVHGNHPKMLLLSQCFMVTITYGRHLNDAVVKGSIRSERTGHHSFFMFGALCNRILQGLHLGLVSGIMQLSSPDTVGSSHVLQRESQALSTQCFMIIIVYGRHLNDAVVKGVDT